MAGITCSLSQGGASGSNTVIKPPHLPPHAVQRIRYWWSDCLPGVAAKNTSRACVNGGKKPNRLLFRLNYWHKDTCILMKKLFTEQGVQEIQIPMGFPIVYLKGIPLFIVTFIKKLIADKFITHHVHRSSVIFGCVFLYSAFFLTISEKSLEVPVIVILTQIVPAGCQQEKRQVNTLLVKHQYCLQRKKQT